MTVPQPGWYPDPGRDTDSAPAFRWWDGQSWTAAVSDSATAPPPTDSRSGGRPHPGRVAALALGVTLLLTGGLVGTFGWLSPGSDRAGAPTGQTTTAGRAPAGSSAPARHSTQYGSGPQGRLDEVTREARIANAVMVLPPDPYELVSDPVTVPGVFDAMFVANAPVHPRYDGSHNWSASVALAHVSAESFEDDDPADFAEQALDGLTQQFFGHHPTKIKKLNYSPTMVDGKACVEVTAQVHYRIKQLDSRFDRVQLVGCPAADGGVVAAISSVPDDAEPKVSRLAAESVASLELT